MAPQFDEVFLVGVGFLLCDRVVSKLWCEFTSFVRLRRQPLLRRCNDQHVAGRHATVQGYPTMQCVPRPCWLRSWPIVDKTMCSTRQNDTVWVSHHSAELGWRNSGLGFMGLHLIITANYLWAWTMLIVTSSISLRKFLIALFFVCLSIWPKKLSNFWCITRANVQYF